MIRITLFLCILAFYSWFIVSPFSDRMSTLERELESLEKSKDKVIDVAEDCIESRDVGTKRFIDFIDGQIDTIVTEEKNVSLPSWSGAVLGIKSKGEL